MPTDRRWVQRLIAEETSAAIALIVAGAIGLLTAAVLGGPATTKLLHPRLAGHELDLAWLSADGLLVVFFFVAGLELRHELRHGSLTSLRQASVPLLAAVLGMVTPALLFVVLAPADLQTAWGVPMATDLPLALALVALVGRRLPIEFRAFILSLAIVDDALSILVIAVNFGGTLSFAWCLITIALVVMYARVQRFNGWLALVVALLAWAAMLQTGIHATVLGVALGVVSSRDTDRVRDRWQPFAGLVAVPLFVATALAIPVTASDVDGSLIASVSTARIIGKPLGVGLGALLALAICRPRTALPRRAYFVAGAVASMGFSVSVLFAELALDPQLLQPTKVAIVAAMTGCAVTAVLALTWLRAASTE